MKCTYVLKGGNWPCGQCLPCLIKKRRTWSFRILEESKSHADSVFVTLTYDDDNLPKDASLDPRDVQLWLKRVRRYVHPQLIRVFYVGEYGDTTFRPHYHAVLFGLDISHARNLHKIWGKCSPRRFTVTPLSEAALERSQYISSYTVKKMTKKDDPRLGGRHPEFARMSLKNGGIGIATADKVASSLLTSSFGRDFLKQEGDVPSILKSHGRTFPIGRYLRGKIRDKVQTQIPVSNSQREFIAQDRFQADLQLVREGSLTMAQFDKKQGFIREKEKVDQMALNLSARQNLKRKRM